MAYIPYMGSKKKIAKQLLDKMLEEVPKAKYFYDLFGGGASMSIEAIKSGKFEKVFYNEIDLSIVNLLKKIKNDGVTPDFYNWISRAEFFELKKGTDWRSGLAKTCWLELWK